MGERAVERFFRNSGRSFSTYFTHAGQQEVLAGFEPAQELGGFLAHGEVRAEDGVVHLVRAHDLERGDELIEHVFARGEAVGFADGDAHGGRDLNDDSLLRVLQGFPRGADVVLDGDGAGGAHGGALSAADAVRLAQGLIVRRGDVQAWAAAGKAQIADALHLVADAHTVAAEDALVEVHRDGGAGEVHLDVLARIVEAQVVQSRQCAESSSSMIMRRYLSSRAVLVRMCSSFFGGMVQAASIFPVPSSSTMHIRHAP